MPIRHIPGQDRAKRMLLNGLRQSKLSHAYLFDGPPGSGRREMALALAQALFCLMPEDGDACGSCMECRKVEHGNHPDVVWMEPDGASIKIDQVRDLQKEFAYKSTQSGMKVYVMQQAERMTIPAANSLLKFLEEPLSPIVAVLITANGQALLPTIRSRVQWIPFYPVPKKAAAERLCAEGLPATLVLPAVQLTAGLEAARELIQGNWFAEARNVMIQLMKEALTRLPAAMLTLQNKWLKTDLAEHTQAMLDLQLLWLKDMILLGCGRSGEVVYSDQTDWMAREAAARPSAYWVRGMELTAEAQKRLRMNANPQLALEKLLIDIQGG